MDPLLASSNLQKALFCKSSLRFVVEPVIVHIKRVRAIEGFSCIKRKHSKLNTENNALRAYVPEGDEFMTSDDLKFADVTWRRMSTVPWSVFKNSTNGSGVQY